MEENINIENILHTFKTAVEEEWRLRALKDGGTFIKNQILDNTLDELIFDNYQLSLN